jgi:hypothetical protein
MPVNNVPLINGKAYSWACITFLAAGANITGITAITYGDETEKENGYGAGQMPVDRGEGNYIPEASMTLKANEIEKIIDQSPTGRIQDFGVFDVIVEYLVGTVRKTHKLRNVEFTGHKRDIKQGDKQIESECPLVISHIEWK